MRERLNCRVRGSLPVDRSRLPNCGDIRNGWRRGSVGGAPVWRMRAPWMSSPCTCKTVGREACKRHQSGHALTETMRAGADPDGFAVFGRFPKGLLAHLLRHELLGAGVGRADILHVCSGTLSETEAWTVDVRRGARPRVLADGRRLPFRDGSFRAVLIDPPYSEAYARALYGVENPRPSHLLREAARVVRPGGRIGLLHVAVPFTPPGCFYVDHWGISTGMGYRIRAFTLFERRQAMLDGVAS